MQESSETSRIWIDDDETLNEDAGFTQMLVIPTKGYSTLVKAKRQGQWWVLKGLKEEFRPFPLYAELQAKEFRLLSRLHHPAVVQVVGMETVAHLGPCIVMEHIDGMTLDEFLSLNPSRKQRLRVIRLLCEALDYVHSCQIVHRDLKPSNILVTHNGNNVKLIDFGLSDSDAYAMLKHPAGTLRYMSPEQREGGAPDVRNDIYSLGQILEDCHLGVLYGGIARRCMCAMDRRYPSAAAVWGAIDRRRRLPRIVAVVLLAFVCIGTCAMLWHRISEREEASERLLQTQQNLERTQRSLEQTQQSLAQSRAKDSAVIASLHDSLAVAVKAEQDRRDHEAYVAQIEEQGRRMVETKVRQARLNEEKDPQKYLERYNKMATQVYKDIETFAAGAKNLSASERDQLKNILYTTYGTILRDTHAYDR